MRSFKIFLTKDPYGNDPSQWAIPGLSFLNFCFFNTVDSKQMVYNFLPTTGFEPWTSCVEATTLSTKSQPLTNCCLCYLLFSSSTKPYLIFTFCDLTFFFYSDFNCSCLISFHQALKNPIREIFWLRHLRRSGSIFKNFCWTPLRSEYPTLGSGITWLERRDRRGFRSRPEANCKLISSLVFVRSSEKSFSFWRKKVWNYFCRIWTKRRKRVSKFPIKFWKRWKKFFNKI